jgi:aspartate aminotransferase
MMMSDNAEMKLARVDLGPGWIDLGYGEPITVLQALRAVLPAHTMPSGLELLNAPYQPPQGNKDLVALLENKYKARVVITNGAKQGIAAVMYAVKQLGHKSCVIPKPYWVSTPGLITSSGLTVEFLDKPEIKSSAIMITSPNNPDGKEVSKANLESLALEAKQDGVMFIHDAAYHTPIYMGNPDELFSGGDAQVYSFAKMYGLSGLRVGYVVLHNEALLSGVTEFVEKSCSGVSTASQQVALAVERFFTDNPGSRSGFEFLARSLIIQSRKELERLRPEVLEVVPCSSNSMFAWCKVGPELDWKNAKVNILSGEPFGAPGYVRLNLAVNSDLIHTAIDRLNQKVSKENE